MHGTSNGWSLVFNSTEAALKQVQALQLCFSRETLNIVDNLGLTAAQKADQAQIIAALKVYVDGQVNESIERRNLRQRTQQVGELFDDFLIALRELAKTCNFCNNDCLQKAIRDQIIEGLQDGESIQELLQMRDPTLDNTVAKCRGLESAKKSRQDIQHMSTVNAVRTTATPTSNPARTCPGCGNSFHNGGRKNCPAFNQTCRHFGRACRQNSRSKLPTGTPQSSSLSVSTPHITLSNIDTVPFNPAPRINIQAKTPSGEAIFNVLPDSGADICAASWTTVCRRPR